ncbi:MAG: diadenylate cyclase CdaA [Pyrinomonadaceae bacterium]
MILLQYNLLFARIFELRNILDIALVFLVVYAALRLVRGTRGVPMVAGIALFILLYWLAVREELTTLLFLLRGGLAYVGVAVIVLFQSEIRHGLTLVGNRIRAPFMRKNRGQFGVSLYDEIVLAASTLASTKTGALIVIERHAGLQELIEAGLKLDAELSYDLLVTIFHPETPLHDGAVVVRGQRIAAASCFLPLTQNPRLTRDLGTRHRAAIGVTEDSDAVVIVVSEETGIISFVHEGQIRRGLDAPKLRTALLNALEPRRVDTQETANEAREITVRKTQSDTLEAEIDTNEGVL